MRTSPLVDRHGRASYLLGGGDAWKTAQDGEWLVSLEWGQVGQETRRYLVIVPASSILQGPDSDRGGWAISHTSIVHFVDFNGSDKCTGTLSRYGLEQIVAALPTLGRDANDQRAVMSLARVLERWLLEINSMPATPMSVRREHRGPAMWDVEVTDKATGKTLMEAEG